MSISAKHGRANGWAVKRGTRRYEARWYDADGGRRAKVVDDDGLTFTRKGDAERYAKRQAQKAAKIRSGEIAPDRPDTVDELLDAFVLGWSRGIGTKKGQPPDPATVRKVRQQLKHVRSTFGTRRPDSLRKIDLENWRLDLPAGSRHDVFRAARQAFAWAVRYGLLDADPSAGIENPTRTRDERKPVFPFESWDEIEKVAAELENPDGRHKTYPCYRAVPIVAAGTGLRPEELFALHRSDVDLENRRIHVHRRYSGGVVKEGTKTGAERYVPYGERVAAALREMPPIDTPVLFPSPRGGYIDLERFRHREWAPALRAAGLNHRRVNDLRHTYASWSLAAGVPVAKLAKLMGTSIAQIESTYHRFLLADEERYGTALDNYGSALG